MNQQIGKITYIIKLLENQYPTARIALTFSNPLELLVATILSAQCTDAVVNKVTPALFDKYRSPKEYSEADTSELENIIHSCGFYRNKAKSIQGAARTLLEKYDGKVPDTMAEMLALPGVARKTANVVLHNAFGKEEGIAVDTHVKRVSRLLSLTTHNNPDLIEKDLMSIVPKGYWGRFTYLLIEHGRNICIARRPKCHDCVLSDLCPSAAI
ncbi:MAG: endonuclease III [Dehalococcoidales bacterium]|nr:endonuclease III [Dehalococcoidales bacterium]MDD5605111.1 endonuclease III [Dehalococcoidales bacterium]MDX9986909.1 endonuclease III [Dehalococcoidales bacterium]NLE90401.1 endonuclease III [Dehalococcoidales bacterium]